MTTRTHLAALLVITSQQKNVKNLKFYVLLLITIPVKFKWSTHRIDTSSLCRQLFSPHPAWPQSNSEVSSPWQLTSSNQMLPVPGPNWF